jgi:hypothetical protein
MEKYRDRIFHFLLECQRTQNITCKSPWKINFLPHFHDTHTVDKLGGCLILNMKLMRPLKITQNILRENLATTVPYFSL